MFFTPSKLSLALLASPFAALVFASPVKLSMRDVFVPPITAPIAGAVWPVGSQQTVTWDVSDPPEDIANPIGTIVLAKAGLVLDLDDPLATGFSILDGSHVVTVPDVTPGDDYSLVLFGDSGNFSPEFSITA
ncbi:hypothetical protein PUNSTDRAFT_137439 [Punctularia strigosozonata HHB-11173 SS5]|uniref:uncharacterized protein n=1 Tax=Punctularia strigosozonata (strain HHB-11173) TaxID=741275 RepID=UPI0004416E38|nr:uncharacterized protein PUNSTDRAFT_137439 [Punctularia strigosozonata HHB-11173 SS5]EIN05326.1 hypothetical protein PUNSTDRAFT_137439 [Punctularia strigosozonata HHB-11173 SS5]